MPIKAVHATVELRPEYVEETKKYILDYAKTVRTEEGNIRFDVYLENNTLFLDEGYKSQEAFDHHCSTPYFHELMAFIQPKTVPDGIKLHELTPLGTTILDEEERKRQASKAFN